jgi:hypothetical protein
VRRGVLVAVLAAIGAAGAWASAPPVGPLPDGPTTTVKLAVGKSYVARLPQPKAAGRVWRVARAYDGKVVQEVREAETKSHVLVTFHGGRRGSTRVVFALTRGETSHAYGARRFLFVVG